MNLNVGYLENYISDFVAEDISASSSETLKLTIIRAFKDHTRVEEARSEQRYVTARPEIPEDAIESNEEDFESDD